MAQSFSYLNIFTIIVHVRRPYKTVAPILPMRNSLIKIPEPGFI